MGESWIVSNLNAALSTWNDKLAEIWSLLTESPQTFKDGQVWGVMTGIHGALQAIGYGLLVLFFAVGVMKTCGSFVEVKKPEHALKLFIRFALAKGAVTYGLELMLSVLLSAFDTLNEDYTLIGARTIEKSKSYKPVMRLSERIFPFLEWVGEQVPRQAREQGEE